MKLINLINPSANLAEIAQLCAADDLLLLRQDAVYLACQPNLAFPVPILALLSDVTWRQLRLPAHIRAISDAEWVKLSAQAEQNLLWS